MSVVIAAAGSIVFTVIFLFVLYLVLTDKKRIVSFLSDIHTRLIQEGIDASMQTDNNYYLDKIGQTVKKTSDFIKGVFDIKGEEFDYIFFRTKELNNFWDFIVTGYTPIENKPKTHLPTSIFHQRVTRLHVQNKSWLFGKSTTVYWKGDESLSNALNTENALNKKIINVLSKKRQLRKIFIFWDNRYAVIRTPIYTPSSEDFDIINMISLHIKSTWFS